MERQHTIDCPRCGHTYLVAAHYNSKTHELKDGPSIPDIGDEQLSFCPNCASMLVTVDGGRTFRPATPQETAAAYEGQHLVRLCLNHLEQKRITEARNATEPQNVYCPDCNAEHDLNAAAYLVPRMPNEGDVTICRDCRKLYCLTWDRATIKLKMVPIPPEMSDLNDDPKIRAMQERMDQNERSAAASLPRDALARLQEAMASPIKPASRTVH